MGVPIMTDGNAYQKGFERQFGHPGSAHNVGLAFIVHRGHQDIRQGRGQTEAGVGIKFVHAEKLNAGGLNMLRLSCSVEILLAKQLCRPSRVVRGGAQRQLGVLRALASSERG